MHLKQITFKDEHKSIIKILKFLAIKKNEKQKQTIEYIPSQYGKWDQIQG
jgi:hypothetical protein